MVRLLRLFKSMMLLVIILTLGIMLLAGCGGGDNGEIDDPGPAVTDNQEEDGNGDEGVNAAPAVMHPDFDDTVTGEITIMTWSGDGQVWWDAGRQNPDPEDINSVYTASLLATARVFNEIYPNVVINFYTSGGGADYWEQRRDDFAAEHGHFPDIFKSRNLVADAQRGLIADLSVFADDPRMQRINPAIVEMYTRHGMIFGLPLEVTPNGVFVNRELAEMHNITPPRPDWNIHEFTAFTNNTNETNFWGQYQVPHYFLDYGHHYTHYSMARPGSDGIPFVNLEADAVRDVLELVPTWTNAAIQNIRQQGLLPAGVMEQHHWWRIHFWSHGAILSHHCNAWELGRVATVAEAGPLIAVSNDWDLYPFPSTATRGNTVRLLLTPWAIFNYAMDDGDPELNDEEMQRLEVAFNFMMFYMTDNRAWEARAAQEQVVGTIVVEQGVSYLPAISTFVFPSFPVVTGPDFDFQLNTMFTTESFSQLADADRFPGFHTVMDIMQNGDTIGIGGTAFPFYVEEAGQMVNVAWEWEGVLNPDIAGAYPHDPEWLGNVLARLPEWNRNTNERLVRADQELRDALERWYGRTFD